jgi:hypothetical protein
VAGFLPAHGFGEAKPKPCEGWRRGPDEALAKSDAPLAQVDSSFIGLPGLYRNRAQTPAV